MNEKQFMRFLEHIEPDKPNLDKISEFIRWCNRYDLEELILRLSSETKGGISNNYFLDFTTKRLILRNKRFIRKFLDLGYVAGLAPLPMVIIGNKVKEKIVSNAISLSSKLSKDSVKSIEYSDIEELIFKRGIDNTIINMFGRMIVANYIIINTREDSYEFTLPVNKNGQYESILPWLQLLLPIKST